MFISKSINLFLWTVDTEIKKKYSNLFPIVELIIYMFRAVIKTVCGVFVCTWHKMLFTMNLQHIESKWKKNTQTKSHEM